LQGVIRGVGELEHAQGKQARKFENAEKNLRVMQQDLDLPYLLLDLRDSDEYQQCHIITALNYPTAMLSRSMNNETPELLAYKNQAGKIIAIYDDDEKIGCRAAATLVQRGYDNLFLLSGGLKYAAKKFPDGLIVGSLPSYISSATTKKQDMSSSNRTNRSDMSISSNISNTSKKTFDRDDIEKLNHYLDENLMPDPSSRLSRNTKSSRVSNAASNASTKTVTSIHSKPFYTR
jgi:centrosomal protein CEP41